MVNYNSFSKTVFPMKSAFKVLLFPFTHFLVFCAYLFVKNSSVAESTSFGSYLEILVASLPFFSSLCLVFFPFNRFESFLFSLFASLFFFFELVACWLFWIFLYPHTSTSISSFHEPGLSPLGETYFGASDSFFLAPFAYHAVFSPESLMLLCLTALILAITIVSVRKDSFRTSELYSYFFFISFLLVLVFTQYNLILFYIFFERTLFPMFVVIRNWGSRPERQSAANRFFIFTVACSIPFLLSLISLYDKFGTLDRSFLPNLIQSTTVSYGSCLFLTFSFFLCFAVKLPLFPFHVWLPEAHVEAPTPGSMFLAGILLKMGGYAIYRFLVPLFGHFLFFSTFTCTIFKVSCVLSILYGRLGAIAQTDIKKVVAYSSVSHMGFCTLGFLPSESPLLSNAGAFGLMIRHGLTSRALFFLVGELYFRYGTRSIASFSGIASLHPIFASYVLFFSFSNIGFPGTPGYPPEVFILSSLSTFFHLTWAAALGSLLGAFYTLFAFVRILWGPLSVPPVAFSYYSHTAERDDLSILDSLALFVFLVIPSSILSFFPRVLYAPFEYFF